MRMYGALLLAVFSLFIWPERNVLDIPFSQLTLGLLGKTAFFLFVGYWALRAAFSSLAEDKFWPWRWTKQIVKSLAARAAMLGALAGAIYLILEHSKLGAKLGEYPILMSIVLFIAVTWIVCMSDEDIFGQQPAEGQNAEAKP